MIPYTLAANLIVGPGAPENLVVGDTHEVDMGALPRALRVDHVHIQAYIILPIADGGPYPELQFRAGVPARVGPIPAEPLRTYGNYRVQLDDFNNLNRYQSTEYDSYHEGIVFPQCSHLVALGIAQVIGFHMYRYEITVSGYLMTESMQNSMEANQWAT